MTRSSSRLLSLAASAVLFAAACSGKVTDTASDPAVVNGPGVTDATIKLGVLTDNSGVFAGPGKATVQGIQAFWEEKNRSGGVCRRQVELLVRDHGYNVQNAVSLYAEMEPEVLAFQHLLGSPMSAALAQSSEEDEVLAIVSTWSQGLLKNPYYVVPGTTYDLELANGLAWLAKKEAIARGTTIGHIYVEGDYGESALAGSKSAAADLGLRLVEQKIRSTDPDLSVQVAALRDAGARHVLLTTTPAQTASAVSSAAAANYGLTFLGSSPSFHPALLDGTARNAFESTYVLAGSIAPYSSPAKGPSQARRLFEARFPNEAPTASVTFGYGQGQIMAAILDAACQAGAFDRPALLKAFQAIDDLDTGGTIAPLDYSKPGKSPATKVAILKPNKSAHGGLDLVQDLTDYPEATKITHTVGSS
jgi:ABC-type branched-subunit amino acid transport system substrate-binding protein